MCVPKFIVGFPTSFSRLRPRIKAIKRYCHRRKATCIRTCVFQRMGRMDLLIRYIYNIYIYIYYIIYNYKSWILLLAARIRWVSVAINLG